MLNFVKWVMAVLIAVISTFALFVGLKLLSGPSIEAPQNSAVPQVSATEAPDIADPAKTSFPKAPEKPVVDRFPEGGMIPPIDVRNWPIPQETFIIQPIAPGPQPIVRFPPVIPRQFLEGNHSGHCRIGFDVSAEGRPFEIKVLHCTDDILKKASIRALRKWVYQPQIIDGRPVVRRDVEDKIVYRLLDERGELLPEP